MLMQARVNFGDFAKDFLQNRGLFECRFQIPIVSLTRLCTEPADVRKPAVDLDSSVTKGHRKACKAFNKPKVPFKDIEPLAVVIWI